MKNTILLLSILCSLLIISCSDDNEMITSNDDEMMETDTICSSSRYIEPSYDTIEMTTVKYGEAMNDSGELQELFMDIYTPKGDQTANRPVMILAFGGGFIAGSRETMKALAEEFASLGYVSASIDYRLADGFLSLASDTLVALRSAYNASMDMKAAIRHFRKDEANGNPYNIDESKIFVGGVSAGAIAALNAAVMDEENLIEDHVISMVEEAGGIEGASGDAENLSYSSEVAGVLNLSGGVYRLHYLDENDPPIFSFHGDNDSTVPYGYDFVQLFSVKLIPLYGSGALSEYADEIGLRNHLITIPGGDHNLIYSSSQFAEYREELDALSRAFFKETICE